MAAPSRNVLVTAEQLTIVPANEASWADLQAIFGLANYPGRCYCQRYRSAEWHWNLTTEERRGRLRRQTNCDKPDAGSTTGLVAYLTDDDNDREPVGWVAVEPRVAYPRLLRGRTAWRGRSEDKHDEGVWSVTCFTVRKGYRGRGITYALAAATVGYARANGARALEGYPLIVAPGKEITWGDLHVGKREIFDEAGFTEASRPSPARAVMRIDFP
ncbi:MAG TPA: GNAT family N-acetyltransferase [Trebonia sp.]|jgi:GNAT superfamily N-acetyltransferase|nr:GNAT family N-acetyltransferase [Trebonia sp.]